MSQSKNPSPNPRRVAAGKLNVLKRKPFSAATRERLRLAALVNRPWQKTTGPKTAAGKARSALNSQRQKKDVMSRSDARELLSATHQFISQLASLRQRLLETSAPDP